MELVISPPLLQVTILHANVLDVDFSDATKIFVYLIPKGLQLLADRFEMALRSGACMVSYGKLKAL